MDWTSLRRVVTGQDESGRAQIVIDGAPAKTLAVEEAGLAEIWAARLAAGALLSGEDRLAGEDVRLEPDAGGLKVRWFTVPVENEAEGAEAREAAAAFGFAAAGAAHARVDTTRHPMMHKTNTLDVIVVVRGEIDLLVDDGQARSLKPGDVVIQRATNHAWVNTGNETALLIAVLVSNA